MATDCAPLSREQFTRWLRAVVKRSAEVARKIWQVDSEQISTSVSPLRQAAPQAADA